MKTAFNALFICVLLCLSPALGFAQDYTTAQPPLPVQKMDIQTANGQKFGFDIEIASSLEEKERGLMFREEVAGNGGMLFCFGENYRPYLWMKNTLVPLDMLFLDKDGYILFIKHSARPHSLEAIGSGGEAWAVLELQGGISKKLGIRIGDRVLPARKPANVLRKGK